tara:strand:- start:466 stop:1416 length:951 start_codon:yes stop_codon:yes gene_type:complete
MKYLLKTLLTITASLGVKLLLAQQIPSYSQYTLNRYALNPAVAGLESCSEFTVGNRRQWDGFEGAPETYMASLSTRINKEDKYPENFHGVGVFASDDRFGIYSVTNVKIGYAYHIKLWTNYRLSLGVFAGVQQHARSYEAIIMRNKSIDPAINSEDNRTIVYPEISPGGFIHNRNFYMGLSMFQLFPARIQKFGTNENRLSPHFFYTTGYRIRGINLDAIPSMLVNFSPIVSPTLDFTLELDYQKKVQLAVGSKYLNSAYGILKLRLLKKMTIGYSYEYALNEISQVAPETHEIMIQITSCRIGERTPHLPCPAYR